MAKIYSNYAQSVSFTPQTQPIPGREAEMVPNNAGGYGFKLDDWERLHRFLILGSEGGTYYVRPQKLTQENAACVIRCIQEDGPRVVAAALDVNVNNRAPKVDQQLFVLALCLKHGDRGTRSAAELAAVKMLRTGTHVLHFADMLNSMGGWNRTKRRVIGRWLLQEDTDKLAYQVLKYQSRDGWSMRDLLRVAHPAASVTAYRHQAVYDWICGRDSGKMPNLPHVLQCHRFISEMVGTEGDPVEAALIGIREGLPREALPTEALADRKVWRELLPVTPPHALIRNLGVLTANGTLSLGSPDVKLVVDRLGDREAMKKARVHPFALLLATLVYKRGEGVRGNKTWVPVPAVLEALEDAYDAAFEWVTPTGKRILIGVDISGSMSDAECTGTPISCSTAAAAMAITLARQEPNAVVCQFDTEVRNIVPVTRRTSIANLEQADGGGTDVAAPIMWALEQGQVFDAFVLLTDNETWAGHRQHATQAIGLYRRTRNNRLKTVCCAMAATNANVVDPEDPMQLGAVGLDANIPSIVSEFIGR